MGGDNNTRCAMDRCALRRTDHSESRLLPQPPAGTKHNFFCISGHSKAGLIIAIDSRIQRCSSLLGLRFSSNQWKPRPQKERPGFRSTLGQFVATTSAVDAALATAAAPRAAALTLGCLTGGGHGVRAGSGRLWPGFRLKSANGRKWREGVGGRSAQHCQCAR